MEEDKEQRKPPIKRKLNQASDMMTGCNWREILGQPPKFGTSPKEMVEWLAFHKRKWQIQLEYRRSLKQNAENGGTLKGFKPSGAIARNLGDFVMRSASSKVHKPWQILRISETRSAGVLRMWILVETELISVNVKMQRVFYVNQLKPMEKESTLCRKASKHLPRSQPSFHLYEYSMPESVFQKHQNEIMTEFSNTNVEGIYEMNVPLMFALFTRLGCTCSLKKAAKFKVFTHFFNLNF